MTSRYQAPGPREILQTSKIYHDGKTQVPKIVIDELGLTPGESRVVWVKEGRKIWVEAAEQVSV